ncbi:AraC family transcriptional regulator [Bacteroides sp. 214]|uniref:helix-turn-helix domain-containing protein n=1 Tax=Bacteroides sp. 214 TaxID=2302935 RepID=UPI0013D09253|nr:AraC family transcriptional regulator [Bacteroides sp. 214]
MPICKRLILIIILSVIVQGMTGSNPFLPMLKKNYRQYAKQLITYRTQLDFTMEQSEADTLMAQINEAARIAGTSQWKLEAQLMHITYKFRYKTRHQPGNRYNADSVAIDFEKLEQNAINAADTLMQIRVKRELMNLNYHFIKNYAQAFDIANQLYTDLNHVDAQELPDKLLIYTDMASMYYHFRDYDQAEDILLQIVEQVNHTDTLNLLPNTYNTLGLIQSKHHNNPGEAEKQFRNILALPPQGNESPQHIEAWEAIARGNIAQLYARQGRHQEAIKLATFACETMQRLNDYSFAQDMATLVASICLKPDAKNLQMAHQYIEKARNYARKTYLNSQKQELFSVMARYYTLTANTNQAIAYADSAEEARNQYNRQYNTLVLTRAEQRLHQKDHEAQQLQLKAQQTRATWLQHLINTAALALAIIGTLLIALAILYRRKHIAYRHLAQKAQNWAKQQNTIENKEKETENALSTEEIELMQRVAQLVEKERIFTQPELTLIDLANRLEINRTYLSAAINHCTGQSFSNYLAQLRVREAVRIMSDPQNAKLTIDSVAFNAGFSDRHNFYRAFKRETGLSPTAFRNNIDK